MNERANPDRILRAAIPDDAARMAVLQALGQSIHRAARIAPRAWCVTLPKTKKRRLCLNMGVTEVFVIGDHGGFLVAAQHPSSAESQALPPSVLATPAGYHRIPGAELLRAGPKDLATAHALAKERHFEAIRLAGTKVHGGSIAGCPHARYHRPELIDYLREVLGDPTLPDPITPESPSSQIANLSFREGGVIQSLAKRFIRNQEARLECINHHGASCHICNFDFGETYGDLAKGYIHVHHRNPLAEIGEAHTVDPINDLIPVCANCHAVLHLVTPALAVDEVKRVLQGQPKIS